MPEYQLVTREEWEAAPAKAVTRRGWSVIDEFIVHHTTGATLGADQSDDWARNIQKHHQDVNGWVDLGYNRLVDAYGVAFEGRGLLVVGAHCPDHNTRSVGVAYMGDGREGITEAAKKTIRAIYDECTQAKGRELAKHVHHDFRQTACPGPHPTEWVRAGMLVVPGASAPPPPPAPAAPPAESPEKARMRQLQGHVGTKTDGIWGPNTEAACAANYVGWSSYVRSKGYKGTLAGNLKPGLVAWVQTQCNRKCGLGMDVDGRTGPATNHGIVQCLGQRDGICGPNGFREACR